MAINQWGNSGNQGFAIPMEAATPPLPDLQKYTLAWNPVTQLLSWVPVSIDAITGDLSPTGNLVLAAAKGVTVGGLKVLGARSTGWGTDTGTPLKTGFNTATITLPELAGQVMAMQQAMTDHGLIGA